MSDSSDPYPNARHAVAFHETVDNGTFWQQGRAAGFDFHRTLLAIQFVYPKKQPEHAAEVFTDDFRRYVGAKMGMM